MGQPGVPDGERGLGERHRAESWRRVGWLLLRNEPHQNKWPNPGAVYLFVVP